MFGGNNISVNTTKSKPDVKGDRASYPSRDTHLAHWILYFFPSKRHPMDGGSQRQGRQARKLTGGRLGPRDTKPQRRLVAPPHAK